MSVRPGSPAERPIEAHGLAKAYRGRPAVDGVDLLVRPGEIYGFLGPNGAGRTTTMRMLLGLIRPDAGTIRLFGRDPHRHELAARAGVAGIIEEPRLYSYLSGRRNLQLLSSYDRIGAGPEVIDEALDLVELTERAGDRVSQYSQGMRQRLGIASCLCERVSLALDVPAVIIYTLPVIAIASFGFFLSVVTGQSVPAVGGTLIYAMSLQCMAVILAIKAAHPYLLTNQLTAWHDLFHTPTGADLIVRAAWVSVAFALPPIITALVIFNRRDIAV